MQASAGRQHEDLGHYAPQLAGMQLGDKASLHELPIRHATNSSADETDAAGKLDEAYHAAKLPASARGIPHDDTDPEAAHIPQHGNQTAPLFGPPTTKLIYARHLHDKRMAYPVSTAAGVAVHNEDQAWPEAPSDDVSRKASVDEAHQTIVPLQHEHEHGSELEDIQAKYREAKATSSQGRQAGAAAAASITDTTLAHISGERTDTIEDGVPRQHAELSRSSNHLEPSPSDSRPLVYIYDLPTPLVMRGSHFATDDPVAADLFLVPAQIYCNDLERHLPPGAKMDTYQMAIRTTLDWIRWFYPFWDLYNGADHIWIMSQDHGFCGFVNGEGTVDEISNSIILSHWGLMDYEAGRCTGEDRLRNECTLSTLHPCFDPRKDVVIPASVNDQLKLGGRPVAEWFDEAQPQEVIPMEAHAQKSPAHQPQQHVSSTPDDGTQGAGTAEHDIKQSGDAQEPATAAAKAHESSAASQAIASRRLLASAASEAAPKTLSLKEGQRSAAGNPAEHIALSNPSTSRAAHHDPSGGGSSPQTADAQGASNIGWIASKELSSNSSTLESIYQRSTAASLPAAVKQSSQLSGMLRRIHQSILYHFDLETVSATMHRLFSMLKSWIIRALHLQDDKINPEQAALPLRPSREVAMLSTHNSSRSRQLEETAPELTKMTILYFAGGVREDDVTYSHGVRQTIWRLFHNRPGYKIISIDGKGPLGGEEYLRGFAESVFCLAATGAGWGVRVKLAVTFRCIPVIIADEVQMEYEDVLPYSEFAVRLPQHATYRLPHILEQIMDTPDKVENMQNMMRCVWRFFSWEDKEGRALEALMCSLRRRSHGANMSKRPFVDPKTCELSCNDQM
ncbi:hypothetical protein WJX74_003985 [Apatococcus lobatus]|uniref:Exostosin GT47 domain-containing protein n=1 Tax=Apatococcus lobatus TaxID=904363 RepID=A0AAW1Q914_9CHLO